MDLSHHERRRHDFVIYAADCLWFIYNLASGTLRSSSISDCQIGISFNSFWQVALKTSQGPNWDNNDTKYSECDVDSLQVGKFTIQRAPQ